MKSAMIYLKTTETCQLDCSHCFTSGSLGRKIYFDVDKTINWFRRLKNDITEIESIHIEFHGGEPFLAPLVDMWSLWRGTYNLWANPSYGICTNLVFTLDDEKLEFIDTALQGQIGTSWDPSIRFANSQQYDLWHKNINILTSNPKNYVSLFISLSKDVIEKRPIELLQFAHSLNIDALHLERITINGSARKNNSIIPSNKDLDNWFVQLYEDTVTYKAHDWFDNVFLNSILNKFTLGTKDATFCRNCEQKIFTINADGTIGGCPNSAPEDFYGHIDENIVDLINKPKRQHVIACELSRDPRCYECPVFMYCGGDCHQLQWEGNQCGSARSLMINLKNKDTTNFLVA